MPEPTGRSPASLVGRRLGPYAVGEVLGRGGTATIYRAVDTRRGHRVALKVVDADAAATPGAERARFDVEVRALDEVVHAHVVGLHEHGEADGHPYLALRHVDGPDLAVLLGGRPMPPARALALLDQVADALAAVHAHGLVHLDVKPANVLVDTAAGGVGHVYLADFGLARTGDAARTTVDGGVVGSPAYAAPELLRGEAVDARADVYSLTCVLFACLTGGPPHTGGVEEVVAAHQRGVLPPTGLGPAVDDVLRIGAAPDPAHRWARGDDLLAAARAALGGPAGEPPERLRPPEPPSAGDPFGRSPPPVRPLLAAVVVLVVALLVLGVVLTVG